MAQDSSQDAAPKDSRKDRLIQARVPRELEGVVKEAARRNRLTVSQLIRNLLEDTFEIVNTVVDEVDHLVADSAEIVENVRRGARRVREASTRSAAPAEDALAHVCAWNPVVLNRAVECSKCGRAIRTGENGFAGLSDEPGSRAPGSRAWLCLECAERLEALGRRG
jgi:hypothetical protein